MTIKNNIERMWKVVAKLKIEPFHQDTKPITCKDDVVENMFKVKKQ